MLLAHLILLSSAFAHEGHGPPVLVKSTPITVEISGIVSSPSKIGFTASFGPLERTDDCLIPNAATGGNLTIVSGGIVSALPPGAFHFPQGKLVPDRKPGWVKLRVDEVDLGASVTRNSSATLRVSGLYLQCGSAFYARVEWKPISLAPLKMSGIP